MLKKLFQWIRKHLSKTEPEIVFPDAKTLRKETWENTPYATDKQILKAINQAKACHHYSTTIWNYRITDASKEALEKKDISVEIYTGTDTYFELKW